MANFAERRELARGVAQRAADKVMFSLVGTVWIELIGNGEELVVHSIRKVEKGRDSVINAVERIRNGRARLTQMQEGHETTLQPQADQIDIER